MSFNLPSEFFALAGTLFGMMSFVLVTMMYFTSRRQSAYDKRQQRAMLSAMRSSYESQIARLTKEMTATRDRWQDANHLVLSGQGTAQNISVIDPSPFLKNFGLRAPDYVVDRKLILVLTPFADDEYETFQTIKRACERGGFKCIRGDEEYTPSDILGHIVRLITKARIIIANVDSRNPNVFYELGIAHALSKPTIIISRSLSEVPFDMQGFRILTWTSYNELHQDIQEYVLKTLNAEA
jgi:hypothetical protein